MAEAKASDESDEPEKEDNRGSKRESKKSASKKESIHEKKKESIREKKESVVAEESKESNVSTEGKKDSDDKKDEGKSDEEKRESRKESKRDSKRESEGGSRRESKRDSRRESRRDSKRDSQGAGKLSAQALLAMKKRQPEKKEYDLDRDSFSKGVDPRDKEGKDLDVLVRIQKPLTWLRLASGVRIVDLQDEHFEGVLSMLQTSFLREEALCKSLRLWEDEESVAALMESVTYWLNDGCSVAAVQEGSNELLGALILRVVSMLDHTRTYSRIRPTKCGQLVQGEGYQKIITFRCHLHKVSEVFDKYGITTYLRIYAMCVRPSHRGKGIGMALLKSAQLVGAALGQEVVMGIITTCQMQNMCAKLGMQALHEIYYAQWIQDGVVVFDDPGPGNYSAIVMAKRLNRIAQF